MQILGTGVVVLVVVVDVVVVVGTVVSELVQKVNAVYAALSASRQAELPPGSVKLPTDSWVHSVPPHVALKSGVLSKWWRMYSAKSNRQCAAQSDTVGINSSTSESTLDGIAVWELIGRLFRHSARVSVVSGGSPPL